MGAVSLVGSVTLLLSEETLDRILLPLVSFAAGSLLGGAFIHMLPAALEQAPVGGAMISLLAGFTVFFILEQFLHWHHCSHAAADSSKPVTYLVLIGDTLHNFIGGIAIAGTFLIDIRLGVISWVAAAAHEIPQELGDMAILVHGGWSRRAALLFNLMSGMTFLAGGLLTYLVSGRLDISLLVPFAAGNFLYIAASDLIPEVIKHEDFRTGVIHIVTFLAGLAVMYGVDLLHSS